ncbi:hypothetical protein CGLAR1_12500 [Corynebacterium glutamicum]|nr:hypothetical protein CGLAR1_12500 [Corynebacterium glutamicum]AIK88806.1 hypothetical protein AR0_12635 [Corynebacterium glutamicum]
MVSLPLLAFSEGGLVSSGKNQTQMPTDRRFEDREHACLVCLEKGDFMAEDPKISTSQNRF